MTGFVSLVGAGPWDPELLTLAALRRVSTADVIIADYLVNPLVLDHARAHAELLVREAGPSRISQDGKRHSLPQATINELLVDRAKAGKYVVRLKGGDPMMFGRGAEEAAVLAAAGISFEFVPGVSSPIAAPEAAGIPITHRDHTPAVSFVSGFEAYEKTGQAVKWQHLAQSAGTLVLMMSVRNCRRNAEKLIAGGRSGDTPAAVVRWGTRGIQACVTGTLSTIAERVDQAGLRAPAVLVVGDVVGLRKTLAWRERRPLHGLRIAITRARVEARHSAMALSRAGADVVSLPCLETLPVDDPGPIDEQLHALDGYHGLIVASPRAVDALFDGLGRCGLDARALAGLRIAAVGERTRAQLSQRGIAPDHVAARAHSEGLVQCLKDAGALGRRWLQLRADHSREILRQNIAAAGGELVEVVAYRSVRPPLEGRTVRSLSQPDAGGEGLDAIIFASGRTVEHFVTGLHEHWPEGDAASWIARTPAIAIGPVTARAVERSGFRVASVASSPDDAGLVAAAMEAFGRTEDPDHPSMPPAVD